MFILTCSQRAGVGVAGIFALLLAACGTPQEREAPLEPLESDEGLRYEPVVNGAPSGEVKALLRDALRLYTLANQLPPSLARLRRRAESDMPTVISVLRSEGYYEGEARFEIVAAKPASPPEFPPENERGADRAPTPEPDFSVIVEVVPGPRFTFSAFRFEPRTTQAGLDLAPAQRSGIRPGMPARAVEIVNAEAKAVQWLQDRGHPYARFASRVATLDLAKDTLSVVSRLEPGPRVTFGQLRFEGLDRVDRAYLESYRRWAPGDVYSRSAVDRMQTALFATDLFTAVSVEPPPRAEVPVDASDLPVPITVSARERKRRTVGGGFRVFTDQGPLAIGFLVHRNLFGANESARFTAMAGPELQRLGLSLRKPQFLRDGQILYGGVEFRHEDTDAFEDQAVQFDLGVERKMSDRLTLSGGGRIEISRVDDDTRPSGTARLFGLPLSARYDASNNLLNPSDGFRLRARIIPWVGSFRDDDLLFTSVDLDGSIYRALDRQARYVLAARGRLGSLLGAKRDDLPANKRLYSGGGGSVRGYKYQFIGPLNRFGNPEGGRSVAEANLELRARLTTSIGVVPFIDAGAVSEQLYPDLDDGVQVAAGLGLRYYTPIGPIRADIGFPLNPRDEDDSFQFYLSIGQAF